MALVVPMKGTRCTIYPKQEQIGKPPVGVSHIQKRKNGRSVLVDRKLHPGERERIRVRPCVRTEQVQKLLAVKVVRVEVVPFPGGRYVLASGNQARSLVDL